MVVAAAAAAAKRISQLNLLLLVPHHQENPDYLFVKYVPELLPDWSIYEDTNDRTQKKNHLPVEYANANLVDGICYYGTPKNFTQDAPMRSQD